MTRMLPLAALALACDLSSPAFAAEVAAATPVTAVVLPWCDWIVAIGQTLTSVLLPVLVALLGKAVYQIAPWAGLFLNQARLEQMTKAITDYALNATEGVVKGQALTILGGSAVIAKAKALGIKMGDPWFKIRQQCQREGVRVFFSNYTLYGDMSACTNAVYRDFSPAVEIYSIDESFLDLSDVRPTDRETLCRDMRHPFIVPIPGTRRLDRALENLGAAGLTLTAKDMAGIEGARPGSPSRAPGSRRRSCSSRTAEPGRSRPVPKAGVACPHSVA